MKKTRTKRRPVKPDVEDLLAIERQYPTPPNASVAAYAERYRLAQIHKLNRLADAKTCAPDRRKLAVQKKPQRVR
jgi:hypothetical protein